MQKLIIKDRIYTVTPAGNEFICLSIEGKSYSVSVKEDDFAAWHNGAGLIQDVMPGLSADEREFLISGLNPEEFAKIFGEDDDWNYPEYDENIH